MARMGRTDRASRIVPASPATVFAALVDPDALASWLPPSGMTGRFEHFDLRPGGSYRLVLTFDDPSAGTGKTNADADVVDVRIVDVVPDERIVGAADFDSDDPAFAGTMMMTWAVEAVDGGTLVTFTADDVPVGIDPDDHATGLGSSLANLEAFVVRSEASGTA